MRWYLANHSRVLSHNDRQLINFINDDLPSIPIHAKKEWVRQLDVAKAAWDMERLQIRSGQTVLTNYFQPQTNTSKKIMVS
jgi:hypothetical protein